MLETYKAESLVEIGSLVTSTLLTLFVLSAIYGVLGGEVSRHE